MARSPLLHVAPPILALTLLAAGSPIAMSAETRMLTPPPETHSNPLPFMRHSFAAYAYNTLDCSVLYANHQFTAYAFGKHRPPPPQGDYRKIWKGGYLDIRNFPSPVEVRWTSLDGTKHELTIDLATVFGGQLVWHRVPKDDMRDFYTGPSVPGGPEIVVEVNDRTVNVFTSMFVPTKTEQSPGNALTHFRDDRFLAWTHTD